MKASARQSDERLLTILDRAYRGETLGRIADDMGLAKESVRTQARRVLRADLSESGEPSGVVRLAYPWARV
ncbi:sigma factor-like helix-turn-helix DNA-binding protein [Paracoccus versutus]